VWRIAAAEGLRLLVVFGSLAAGRGTSESDLDIGVLAAEGRAAVAAVSRGRSGRHRAVRLATRSVGMTSLDREVVRRKLAHIAETLEALRP